MMKENMKKRVGVVTAAGFVLIAAGVLRLLLSLQAVPEFGSSFGAWNMLSPCCYVLAGLVLLLDDSFPLTEAAVGLLAAVMWMWCALGEDARIPINIALAAWLAAGVFGGGSVLLSMFPSVIVTECVVLFFVNCLPVSPLRMVLMLALALCVTAASVLLSLGVYRGTDNTPAHVFGGLRRRLRRLCSAIERIYEVYCVAHDDDCDMDDEEDDDAIARFAARAAERAARKARDEDTGKPKT